MVGNTKMDHHLVTFQAIPCVWCYNLGLSHAMPQVPSKISTAA